MILSTKNHIWEIKKILEDLKFSVPMGVDFSYSDTNWAEKIERGDNDVEDILDFLLTP